MKPLTVSAALTALCCLGTAGAQDLAAYTKFGQQLEAAAAGAGQNPVVTLKQLDDAQESLNKLLPTITNRQLATGLRNTFNAVRAAQGRTPAELRAQVELERGLMRRALYDQSMALLAQSPTNGTAQLSLLAREFGLDAAPLSADLKAGKLNLVAWKLQRAAIRKLSSALNEVQPAQTGASYLNLARAASWFTVVQEAGHAQQPPLEAAQFGQALAHLSAGETAELRTSLQTLRQGVSALNRSLAVPPSSSSGGTGGKSSRSSKSPSEVVTQPPVSLPPTNQGTPPPPATASLPAGKGLEATYTSLGRALTASGHADLPTARAELARAAQALAGAPATLRNTGGYSTLVGHIQNMSKRSALRPGDVQALLAELGTLEDRSAGRAVSALDGAALGSAAILGGGLRVFLALLIALGCAAPLYLLNLAFGGRNPFWRAISAALALLLLPAFLDGLFGVLGWLGDVLNVPFLRALLNFTPNQSAFGVPWHMLMTALALGLATYGFRGLCMQFGLLGGKKTSRGSRPAPVKAPDQTSFDWDEEV